MKDQPIAVYTQSPTESSTSVDTLSTSPSPVDESPPTYCSHPRRSSLASFGTWLKKHIRKSKAKSVSKSSASVESTSRFLENASSLAAFDMPAYRTPDLLPTVSVYNSSPTSGASFSTPSLSRTPRSSPRSSTHPPLSPRSTNRSPSSPTRPTLASLSDPRWSAMDNKRPRRPGPAASAQFRRSLPEISELGVDMTSRKAHTAPRKWARRNGAQSCSEGVTTVRSQNATGERSIKDSLMYKQIVMGMPPPPGAKDYRRTMPARTAHCPPPLRAKSRASMPSPLRNEVIKKTRSGEGLYLMTQRV